VSESRENKEKSKKMKIFLEKTLENRIEIGDVLVR